MDMKTGIFALSMVLTISAARSAEIVIDDFSGTLAPTGAVAFLDGTMLGGEMEFVPILDGGETITFQVGAGIAQFSGINASVRGILQWDGNDDDTVFAHALGPVDLTDGSTNDRFEIEFAAVTGILSVKVRVFEGAGVFSEYDATVSSAGTLTVTFDDLVPIDPMNPVSLSDVSLIMLAVDADTGESCSISEFRATGPAVPDTTPPTVLISGGKNLKTKSSKVSIRGSATDNVGVARVEVKEGSRGFRTVSLTSNGTWSYRSSRLNRARTTFVARCTDLSGNSSAQDKVTVVVKD